ncbi:MAG: hypothetical protein U1E50_11545 [Caulobacteraceae bacterium]
MEFLKDRRVVLTIVGGLIALALGLGLAFGAKMMDSGPKDAPPASKGGLVVETGRMDDTKLDAARPLRCFVEGQFVGELTLADCARRNGVATGALDVGIDESGALAGSNGTTTQFTPLPPTPAPTPAPAPAPVVTPAPAPAAAPAAPAPIGAACWKYEGGAWRKIGDLPLNACVQTLYAGHCERRGGATYGRWADQTLRLVPRRVEISPDNRTFRTLVEQDSACNVASVP